MFILSLTWCRINNAQLYVVTELDFEIEGIPWYNNHKHLVVASGMAYNTMEWSVISRVLKWWNEPLDFTEPLFYPILVMYS